MPARPNGKCQQRAGHCKNQKEILEMKNRNGNKGCLPWVHLLDMEEGITEGKGSSTETSRIKVQVKNKTEQYSRTVGQYKKRLLEYHK